MRDRRIGAARGRVRAGARLRHRPDRAAARPPRRRRAPCKQSRRGRTPQRRAYLETCRRHSDLVICEGLPRLHVESVEDGVVRGEVEYEAGGETWRHAFAMRVFADEAELGAALAEAGLRLDARWFTARAA